MTNSDVVLCLIAVISSSSSQLCIKAASRDTSVIKTLYLLAGSGLLVMFSIVVIVWVLQTVQLSQIIPFAAGAYIFIPIGSSLFFNERLKSTFWIGVLLIIMGVILTSLQ